jgi:uncharacterized membrane protein
MHYNRALCPGSVLCACLLCGIRGVFALKRAVVC